LKGVEFVFVDVGFITDDFFEIIAKILQVVFICCVR